MACDEKWVYTPWGYGKLQEETTEKAIVNLTWGGTAYLNPISLSNSVNFYIKLFSSGRKTLEYEWEITQDFSLLFSLLHKQLLLSPNVQLNLYYPQGKLIKISPLDSPLKLKLKKNTKLIGISKQNFTWDSSKKSENIELLDDLLTVKKKDDSDVMYESVLGTVCMSSGIHQWEIKMDFLMEFDEEEEIFIGVAMKNIGLNRTPLEIEYWGFMCLNCKRFSLNVNEDYGENIETGDVVGVKLEYKDGKGTLSFCKNGAGLGNAFCDIPPGVCPAVTLNYPKMQVSLGKSSGM